MVKIVIETEYNNINRSKTFNKILKNHGFEENTRTYKKYVEEFNSLLRIELSKKYKKPITRSMIKNNI